MHLTVEAIAMTTWKASGKEHLDIYGHLSLILSD
jgi:hypothetical protein